MHGQSVEYLPYVTIHLTRESLHRNVRGRLMFTRLL